MSASIPDQLGNPWQTPKRSPYVAETTIFTERGSIELGACRGGLIDMLVSLQGQEFKLWGLRRQEIAEIGTALLRAAETAP